MAVHLKPETIAASNGIGSDPSFRSIAPPIHLTSTFAFQGFDSAGAYEYSRVANPSRDMLADTLAKLEGGARAVITSSGMAAIDLVLSRLGPGDLVIAPHDCYSGTQRLLMAKQARRHLNVAFVDQSDSAAVAAALSHTPSLVLIETPSNPLLRVVDIREISLSAKARGAKVAVDNTFLSPALQKPIELGADIVIHSTTKYLNGHSDVVGGAVVLADPILGDDLAHWANVTGVSGAPFDAYLTLRGIRTLFARIERQQRSAGLIAEFLSRHHGVVATHYPGLTSHPNFHLARRQQRGAGAMLSFEIDGGIQVAARFADAVRVFTLAESLGGVESLVAHPATMTHVGMSEEARRLAGIGRGLLRLSVGLEDAGDLIADLEQALDVARGVIQRPSTIFTG